MNTVTKEAGVAGMLVVLLSHFRVSREEISHRLLLLFREFNCAQDDK